MNDSPILALTLPFVLVCAALYIWAAFALSAVFRKAGEPAWQAWVPFLNTAVLLRLGGFAPMLVLLAFVPVIGSLALYVVVVASAHRVNRGFGHGAGMTVLAAVLFPAWASVLGWGSARWIGDDPAPATGPIRRGIPPELEERVATPYASRHPTGSVFGVHGPAGGPEVPPRPPAPTGGFPSVVPDEGSPAQRGAPLPPPPPPETAFRSTMRDADEGGSSTMAGFESRAPFTQTFPAQGRSVPPASPPAEPIRAVPEGDDADSPPEGEPPAGAPPVTRVPGAPEASSFNTWAPPPAGPQTSPRALRLPVPAGSEPHYETSAEVSAVAGAPTLGSPRAARTSVSAQHGAPEIPDDDAWDETFVAARRRTAWTLIPPLGAPIPLTSDVVILGRRPAPDEAHPDAQLVSLSDETRTVSKTHARLELEGEEWLVIDLDSTNGVILIGDNGFEADAAPGARERLTARFMLGDAELRVQREGE